MSTKALVPTLKAGGRALGIIPQSFDDCFRLAQCAAMSGAIPQSHDAKPEAVCMIIMFGLEIGIPPMQAIQGITKINGKFCIYGDLVPALLWQHGFDIEQKIVGTGDNMEASCTITRPGGKQITRGFSVAQAKVAGLWGKAGPWKQFPQRMLGWRALGFAKSDGASDIMHGMSIVELERDITPERQEKAAVVEALEVPDDIPDETIQVSEAEDNQDQPFPQPERYLAHLADELEGAADLAAFDEIWEGHLEGSDGRLSKEHETAAEALHDKHAARFETK